MYREARILVVDDNQDILTACRLCLKPHVSDVLTLSNPIGLMDVLKRNQIDLVLLDMNFTRDASSGEEGIYYLKQITAAYPQLPVIMMTAYADVKLAVRAMHLGAKDFIAKPWDNHQLINSVKSVIEKGKKAGNQSTESKSLETPSLIGRSEPMKSVQRLMEKVAASTANILILGESGTGKEVVAKSIHAMSQRSNQAFVAVDMGTLPGNLFESELFGYRKGSFTGAMHDNLGRIMQAHQGTLFLDELGNLPLIQQGKLLTVLQSREIVAVGAVEPKTADFRLICATNENLYQQVLEDKFRQDLFYRINTVEIHLPPLRERGNDIDLLLDYYCQLYSMRYGRGDLTITMSDRKWLRNYQWPGNVRELAHCVERAVVLADKDTLDFSQLNQHDSMVMLNTSVSDSSISDNSLRADDFFLEYVERKTIHQALQFYRGNISHAAKALGLTRGAMYRRMEKYQL